jgi:hypothetical protein
MRATLFALPVLSLALLPVTASACSYPPPPSFSSALKGSTNAFVFRLDRAEYKRTDLGAGGAQTGWVEGKVTLIQNLHGDSSRYKNIRFSTFWCGGVNLVVGHHYLIVTNAKGDTIQLAPADGSVLDVDGLYDPNNKKRNLKLPQILPVIRAIYAGEKLPQGYLPRALAARTVVQPPLK